MAKINLDKYYTSKELAKHCINVVNGLGLEITETIEPSAGDGSFSLQIPNCIAYDLEPEHDSIIKQDFLELNLPYKKGRLLIGNPPFGDKNLLAMKFFKHSIKICDYIAFILPISQLNNNQQMFEFDLIYSKDLGINYYSDIKIHCCFNIYKRPVNGLHIKPLKYKLKDVEIREVRKARHQFLPDNWIFDYSFCTWGDLGKTPKKQGEFHQEAYIKINNVILKENILECLKNADWIKLYNMERSPRLKQWQIYKYLKGCIKELN